MVYSLFPTSSTRYAELALVGAIDIGRSSFRALSRRFVSYPILASRIGADRLDMLRVLHGNYVLGFQLDGLKSFYKRTTSKGQARDALVVVVVSIFDFAKDLDLDWWLSAISGFTSVVQTEGRQPLASSHPNHHATSVC
jgi:hypothetical protein